jgi:hypothetical protein
MTAVEYTDKNKTVIILENVFLEDVVAAESVNGSYAKGKLVQMSGTDERQWNIFFNSWDAQEECLEIAKNPKGRYQAKGYITNNKSKKDEKWYTNYIITSIK